MPHHYAFHSGWLGDRMITQAYQDSRLAPEVDVRLVLSGTAVTVP